MSLSVCAIKLWWIVASHTTMLINESSSYNHPHGALIYSQPFEILHAHQTIHVHPRWLTDWMTRGASADERPTDRHTTTPNRHYSVVLVNTTQIIVIIISRPHSLTQPASEIPSHEQQPPLCLLSFVIKIIAVLLLFGLKLNTKHHRLFLCKFNTWYLHNYCFGRWLRCRCCLAISCCESIRI